MSFKNFFTGIRLVGESSDPSNTLPGSLWYNSTTNQLKVSINGTPMTVPTGSTGTPITAQDEGSTLTANMNLINFVGAGVTATNVGQAVTVTIPSGGTPTGTANTAAFFDASGNLDSNPNFVINETLGSTKSVYTATGGTATLAGNGSGVAGSATNGGTLAVNAGFVFGGADGAGSTISASGGGAAQGIAINGGLISGTNLGSLGSGHADGLVNIVASGKGTNAGGFANAGEDVIISGDGSLGHGSGLDVSSDYGQALGRGHDNSSYGSTYVGTYSEVIAGTPGSPGGANDPVFVVGNGTNSGTRNSAIIVDRAGHLRSNQLAPPTATPDANAGVGAICVVNRATDLKGEIVLTTGTGAVDGSQLAVTYDVPYLTAPIIGITPSNEASSLVTVYLTSTTTDLIISVPTTFPLNDATEYRWTYVVIE